ncbi:YdeI/OmpD-associated family protein [Fictibacillus enclensis]|uniref:YdeI/OmpD-associated family protein n=1 Tax=Fictibacillus enclensis TaxID=1017270 RepID=UPI0024C0B036|nr:YdeI/OmpD-associated family protein [Fictibacillus enclensis]MDM5336515.1 YdeI/OmpD-associated family protein [Fictibacillus enclensis]WHY72971.1 YdeI/OmpD-associated family protein [Fictibacillus enclensis]
MAKEELPAVWFESQQALEKWLEEHHVSSPGIRIHIAKKNSGKATPSYAEAVESALCYGWIDSRKEKYDDQTWLQRFTPRGPKSIWSKVNKEKAEELLAAGRMKSAGLRAIEMAKENGLWEKAYSPQSEKSLPVDFQKALDQRPNAKAYFETLNSQNRYAILFRLQTAKKPETRMKRMSQFLEMLEKGEKIYP